MAFVVLYDANVLYPSTLRDVLIRIAQGGLVQAKWTDRILDETFSSIKRNHPDIDIAKLDRTRVLMNQAVLDCLVTGYEPLEHAFELPDPDDRHVLAAAVKSQAQVIVTENIRDFPDHVLEPLGIETKTADEFLVDQYWLNEARVVSAIQQVADSWKKPPGIYEDVLDRLAASGLLEVTELLRGPGGRFT
ncbi:PIN domain-containing protein [Labedaea rhizosphaerae]|uniref:PIN domain-containing protein n=1 Tax=Labedaea rhizosphaerae TaxID=598644 RepID=A0A4R6S412_LABRH|nr:PIN domain-containing protein [Labedaea rhizosphaerae]TDP93954.1 PIN domain-containing protein [Labedaea rhizosphaerae]